MEENICYLAFMGVNGEGIDQDTIEVFYSEQSALQYLADLQNKCDPEDDGDKYFEVKKCKISK